MRLDDFVNESTIRKIVYGFGKSCASLRNQYAAVLEDLPEGWNLSNALTYIGLGILAPIKAISPNVSAETTKEQFAGLFVNPQLTPGKSC